MAETTPELKRIVKRYRIQLEKMGIHPTRVLLYGSNRLVPHAKAVILI
jgi:hypothetical protein